MNDSPLRRRDPLPRMDAGWRSRRGARRSHGDAPRRAEGTTVARRAFADAFRAIGADGLECEFHAELETGKDGPELVVTLVNTSPEEVPHWETTVYEASLEVEAGTTLPFTLDNLPDSFRYDRT